MAFKSSSGNPLSRTIDLTDTLWEYDAPRFFDFSRVHEYNLEDESDYFSMFCDDKLFFINGCCKTIRKTDVM